MKTESETQSQTLGRTQEPCRREGGRIGEAREVRSMVPLDKPQTQLSWTHKGLNETAETTREIE